MRIYTHIYTSYGTHLHLSGTWYLWIWSRIIDVMRDEVCIICHVFQDISPSVFHPEPFVERITQHSRWIFCHLTTIFSRPSSIFLGNATMIQAIHRMKHFTRGSRLSHKQPTGVVCYAYRRTWNLWCSIYYSYLWDKVHSSSSCSMHSIHICRKNAFNSNGPLWRESTSDRCIPLAKGQ